MWWLKHVRYLCLGFHSLPEWINSCPQQQLVDSWNSVQTDSFDQGLESQTLHSNTFEARASVWHVWDVGSYHWMEAIDLSFYWIFLDLWAARGNAVFWISNCISHENLNFLQCFIIIFKHTAELKEFYMNTCIPVT